MMYVLFGLPQSLHSFTNYIVVVFLFFQNYTKKQVTAHIPVGNSNLKQMITICTIATSWTVSVYIIIALVNKRDAIRNKLK